VPAHRPGSSPTPTRSVVKARAARRAPARGAAAASPEEKAPARRRGAVPARGGDAGKLRARHGRVRGRLVGRWARLVALLVASGALCAGAYAAARESSMFALRGFVIVGGSARVEAEVRAALAPELGKSLLLVSGAAVDRAAARLPSVVSLRFARSFPHTLRVEVVPERAVLLVRRGRAGFVVSSRGRVMAETRQFAASPLPRLWVRRTTPLSVGETLRRPQGLLAAAAAAALDPGAIPGGVRSLTQDAGDVTLLTRSGFQIRLGDIGDLALKLTIAARIMAYAGPGISGDAYVDVSVPQRPVLGSKNSQVESTG